MNTLDYSSSKDAVWKNETKYKWSNIAAFYTKTLQYYNSTARI